MATSLYGLFDPGVGGWTFGVQPYDTKYWSCYMQMQKPVRLKTDFEWGEVKHLQNILRKADIWRDFPARGYTLVNAEFKGGDEDQRIDLLYMRDDGALLPCELKIGGEAKDSHGQLIRYIADLHYQPLTLAWVKNAHSDFVSKITDGTAQSLHQQKFDEFLDNNQIEDRFIRILPKTGVLMDEDFPSQLLKAVRYLNGYCGFSIRLLKIACFVEENWVKESDNFMFRMDFIDVQ